MTFATALTYGLCITFIFVLAALLPHKVTLRSWREWFGVR